MVLFIVLSGVMGIVYAPMRNAGTRQRKKRKPMEPLDGAMAADLLQAALKAGTSIPGALIALDVALGEEEESSGLQVVGRLLVMGATWDEAWNDVPARFDMLRDALQPAWEDGAAPLPLLERGAQMLRQSRERQAREAAARLGSLLVLPLGLCFLPAFVLIGIVPVIAAAGISIFQ